MTVQLADPRAGVAPPDPACWCCQQKEKGLQTHCPACHMGLHSTPYAYLVIAPPVLMAYYDQAEAIERAEEVGAVVAALPIVADFRNRLPMPAVGRAQLAAVPAPRPPEEILPPAPPVVPHDVAGFHVGRVADPADEGYGYMEDPNDRHNNNDRTQ